MQILTDLTSVVSEKKPTFKVFFSPNDHVCHLSPLNARESQKSGITITYLTDLTIYNVSTYLVKNIKNSVQTV